MILNKKIIFNIRSFLSDGKILSIFSAVAFFLIFNGLFEELISTTLVKYVFSYSTSSLFNDIIFFAISCYILILYISRLVDYKTSTYFWIVTLCCSVIYLYYRILQSPWTFVKFYSFPSIFYGDILLLITFLNSFIFLKGLLNQKTFDILNHGFVDDSPLLTNDDDELGFTSYINTLSESILMTQGQGAIALGINAKWGSGKTSFLNLLRNQLRSKEVIIVNFDPWNYTSSTEIIKNFFLNLQVAISPYHSTINKSLTAYSNQLISTNDNDFSKYLQLLFSGLSLNTPSDHLYDEINTALQEVDKKLIIFIDDLDRLDTNEIVEVIRLIRNTASFKNTFFLVAYDRSYVLNALKKHNSFNHSHFLEKIFQMEVTLPYYNPTKLKHKVVEYLKQSLDEKVHKKVESEILSSGIVEADYLNNWIKTPRDVSRIRNSMSINFSKLQGEVLFSEFFQLELLRLKFPFVYELIYKETDKYFNLIGSNNNTKYVLKNVEKENDTNLTALEDYLAENLASLPFYNSDISIIMKLIKKVFDSGFLSYSLKDPLSVVNPSRFSLYFAYSLLDDKLSAIEFADARRSGLDIMKTKIKDWLNKGLVFELTDKFLAINTFDSRVDYETVVESIFFLGKTRIKDIQIGFDYENLIQKLSDRNDVKSVNYYNGDPMAFKAFVRNLLANADSPYIFEGSIVEIINNRFEDTFTLSKEEMKGFGLEYFEKYSYEVEKIDSNVWDLFNVNKFTKYIEVGNNHYKPQQKYHQQAINILVSIMDKNVSDALKYFLHKTSQRDVYYLSDLVLTIFEDYNQLKIWLDLKPKSPEILEFLDFYKLYELTGFTQPVMFKFQYSWYE